MNDIKADLTTLANAAAGWEGIGSQFKVAKGLLTENSGKEWAFGLFAEQAAIPEQEAKFLSSMIAAMSDAETAMQDIGDAIRAAARALGATDLKVADRFHKADGSPAEVNW